MYNHDNVIAYFLIYVDDLLLTRNNATFFTAFKKVLALKFSLKDLGTPNHFLGIEILPTDQGLFLSQHHYIRDLLLSTHLHDPKLVTTPLSTSCDLTPTMHAPSCDAREYLRIIGTLQYLTLTRADVSFPVNKLSQYMQAPTDIHMQEVKCLLHYLKGTIDHGLHLSCLLSFSHFIL